MEIHGEGKHKRSGILSDITKQPETQRRNKRQVKEITCDKCDSVTYYEKTPDQRFRRNATKSRSEERDDIRVQKRK